MKWLKYRSFAYILKEEQFKEANNIKRDYSQVTHDDRAQKLYTRSDRTMLVQGKKGGYWNIPVVESDPCYCAVCIFRLFRWTMGNSGDGYGSDRGGGGDDGGGWTHRSRAYCDDSHSSTSRALQNYIQFGISRSHWAVAAAAATISDCAFLRYVYAGSARIYSLFWFFYSFHSGIFVRCFCFCFFFVRKEWFVFVKRMKGITTIELVLGSELCQSFAVTDNVSLWMHIVSICVYLCVHFALFTSQRYLPFYFE